MNEHEKGQVVASAAEIYDEFFVPALFAEWPEHILKAVNLQQGDRLLDVACGTGVLARKAATILDTNGSVVGVDINEGMLAVARRKASGISWRTAPAEALPFEDNAFDRVVCQFGLMFFADQVQALQEMTRVLQPDGCLAVAVWGSLADTPGYTAVAEMLTELFGPEIAQSIEAPYALGNKQKLAALFARAGIDDITMQTITGTARFPSIESWLYTDIKGWTLADLIDDEGYEKLKQMAPQKLSQFALPDGSVAFAAPAHIVTVSNLG